MNSLFPLLRARLRARSNVSTPAGAINPGAVIERALRDAGLLRAESTAPTSASAHASNDAVIEGEFTVVDVPTPGNDVRSDYATTAPGSGSFSAGRFALGSAARDYMLFVPAGFVDERLPLIVMLHGCTQDPEDFARGTRMNLLAQEAGALVLYPAQAPRSNSSRCWNWFQPGDQRREGGEPALLAAMTRHVMATHSVDSRRVHVAGLSAGGAMAAILGREYPDLYASIGVHSGLPPGSAHDVSSAFAAMKSARPTRSPTPAAPVIVFHGDRDRTVHPQNGENVLGSEGRRMAETGDCGRRYTRTVISNNQGEVHAEHWLVHGAGHAWSGGSAEGTYADALGPDASREMLRFFREHPRP